MKASFIFIEPSPSSLSAATCAGTATASLHQFWARMCHCTYICKQYKREMTGVLHWTEDAKVGYGNICFSLIRYTATVGKCWRPHS